MLNDLNGRDEVKRVKPKDRRKVGLIEISGDVGQSSFEARCAAVNGENFAPQITEAGRHRSRAGTQVGSLEAGAKKRLDGPVNDKLVQTFVGCGVEH